MSLDFDKEQLADKVAGSVAEMLNLDGLTATSDLTDLKLAEDFEEVLSPGRGDGLGVVENTPLVKAKSVSIRSPRTGVKVTRPPLAPLERVSADRVAASTATASEVGPDRQADGAVTSPKGAGNGAVRGTRLVRATTTVNDGEELRSPTDGPSLEGGPSNVPSRNTSLREGGGLASQRKGFEAYVLGEFGFLSSTFTSAEALLELDERERVYNTLIYVPIQYERMLWFGLLLCLDSFVSLFTLVPLRAAYFVYYVGCKLARRPFRTVLSLLRQAGLDQPQPQGGPARESYRAFEEQSRADYLCDVLWVLLVCGNCYVLLYLKTSEVFHYIRGQEVIKLYLVLTMLEIFDKISGSLSFDCLETLAASCAAAIGGKSCRGGPQYPNSLGSRRDGVRVAVDFAITMAVMALHCVILMLEAITFNVVLNSANTSLFAMLVSNNFAEIKGTVFKNMNVTRLWTLSSQDIVEHFHISICLVFVLIENMLLRNANLPSYQVVVQCMYILGGEIIVDILKHAFLGKFQNIKPGVYSEYLKDMCEKAASSSSLNVYKVTKFNPLVPAALLSRICVPLFVRFWRGSGGMWGKMLFLVFVGVLWIGLMALKTFLGWTIQVIAYRYLTYYNTTRKMQSKPWVLSSRKPAKKEA